MADAGLQSAGELAAQPPMPVRRLHNYLYCPRLFYLQWVENILPRKTRTPSPVLPCTDRPTSLRALPTTALPRSAMACPRAPRFARSGSKAKPSASSVWWTSSRAVQTGTCVVDYKKGSARRIDDGSRVAKEPDAVQMAAYALLLREQGTAVESAAIYYAEDKRRVPVALTEELFTLTRSFLTEARALATAGKMPPPLVNDRRCDFCSAYPVCLPRESAWWAHARERTAADDAQLRLAFPPGELPAEFTGEPPADHDPLPPPRPPRDDGELLVRAKAGSQVGQRGGEFVVTVQKEVVRKLPLHQVRAIYLYGAVQLTAQAAELCLEHGVDVAYFAASGRFLGLLRGLPASGVDARLGQVRLFAEPFFRLKLARECIRAKISNQRTMLMRNGDVQIACCACWPRRATRPPTHAISVNCSAARVRQRTFISSSLPRCLRARSGSLIFRDATAARPAILSTRCFRWATHPRQGARRSLPRGGPRPVSRFPAPAALWTARAGARPDGGIPPLVADSVAISLVNRGEIDPGDFIRAATGTFLNEQGRRRFWEAWFRRMDSEVSHPEFGYKMSYRRMLEVQARQLWRVVRGDAPAYHGFTTR